MLGSNKYKIISRIGQSSDSTVYKALYVEQNRYVAVKQLRSTRSNNINVCAEAGLLKKLNHPFIPNVYDLIEENGFTYIVMDFIDGIDADKCVKGGSTFTQTEVIKYAIQLCDAVEYLHKQTPKIIHSDIKPSNVMITRSGNIVLIDFNISLILDKGNEEAIGGTPGFAPPEQFGISLDSIKNSHFGQAFPLYENASIIVNELSDIYGIGATLYYMISGKNPSSKYDITPISNLTHNIHNGLLHIITKAMELVPAKRYRSVAQMRKDLLRFYKYDENYQTMVKNQMSRSVIVVVLLIFFSSLICAGNKLIQQGNESEYELNISLSDRAIFDKNFIEANSYAEKATDIFPNRLSAHLQKMRIMYCQADYRGCVNYIDNVISSDTLNDKNNTSDIIGKIFSCAADSAYKIRDYEAALEYSQKAAFFSPDNIEYHKRLCEIYQENGNETNAHFIFDNYLINGDLQ